MSHAGGVQHRGLGGMGVKMPAAVAATGSQVPDMPLSGHLLTFVFTCVTDLALIPPLIVMFRFRRHFEMYIGSVMIVSAFAYNFLDAMNRGDAAEKSWSLLIEEEDWHRISNVSTTIYICLLFIHLMCIEEQDVNIVMRYVAASMVLLAQVKDKFWMQESCYTVYVVVAWAMCLGARFATEGRLPAYWTSSNLMRGSALGLACAVCFYFGLDDDWDEFRFAHGLSHLFGGLSLTFLWNLVPRPKRKKGDEPLKKLMPFV
eukprot:TRINITY_DN110453_c0_g1_i1.p1 TRINITY_DN110453_c0_g1~~TRINITY_DN110453_c0_g1_i1.p1  ORF type:complete len:259 (-),score=44.56 TRINITY_DN110453_c0_g1_i1:42-818(-)